MRHLWFLVLPFVLTSCLTAMLGDPVASSEYVIISTGGDTEQRVGEIVRQVAEANGLRFFKWRDPKPHNPYREYTNWEPGGGVSIDLTLDTRAPLLITIDERYTAYRSGRHRKIAHDLETRLRQAAIAFHKPAADEFLRLKDERFRHET